MRADNNTYNLYYIFKQSNFKRFFFIRKYTIYVNEAQ